MMTSPSRRPLEDANVLQARKLLAALADPGSDTEKDKPKKVVDVPSCSDGW